MTETRELSPNPEQPRRYDAIVIPSYGMSKWVLPESPWVHERPFNEYRMTAFDGWLCKATIIKWNEQKLKTGTGPMVFISGAKIFPNDPKNDADLMRLFLEQHGIPGDRIVQLRDGTNTVNVVTHIQETLRRHGISRKILAIYSDFHDRFPQLLQNYGISSDTAVAEEILSESDPVFKRAWEGGYLTDKEGNTRFVPGIKDDSSYKKIKKSEAQWAKRLKLDRKGYSIRALSSVITPLMGARPVDVIGRKTVTGFASKPTFSRRPLRP